MVKRNRKHQVNFSVTYEEKELINKKIELSNLPRGEFLRKMIIDGRVESKNIPLEKKKLTAISGLTMEISKIGSNINQVAKHYNQVGGITNEERAYLKERLDEIWQLLEIKLFSL